MAVTPSLYPARVRDLCVPQQPISDTSSCCSSESGGGAGAGAVTYGYLGTMPGCRYSLDAGLGRDSLSDSLGSDDSLIMSRLRKSVEQKEKFLNRSADSKESTAAVTQSQSPPPPSRTSKKSPSVWWQHPDQQPMQSPARQDGKGGAAAAGSADYFSKLHKIQENVAAAATLVPVEEDEDIAMSPPFPIVSVRAKQFESGPFDDKTELYRSELARLSIKHNVVDVATRKRDFENRAQLDKQTAFATTRETRSLESANG